VPTNIIKLKKLNSIILKIINKLGDEMKKTVTFSAIILLMSLTFAGGGKNHIGIFYGQTSNTEFKHGENTIGLEYERNLPIVDNMISVGALAEFVLADHTETILMGTVTFRPPVFALKFFGGAGVAIAKHETPDGKGGIHTENESHFALRLGTGYEFHLGRLSVSPSIAWDRINSHSTFVYGVAVGVGF